MKLEVGKKYRIEGSDKPWEVVAVDKRGTAWGLLNGVMAYQNFIEIIGEWIDKPDPGEGWRLLHPDEDVEQGDEWCNEFGEWIVALGHRQLSGRHYRRRIAPQYVPYTWDDREELRGRWLKSKYAPHYEFVVLEFKSMSGIHLRVNGIDAVALLRDYVWIDGSPCGKKVV